MMTSQKGTIMKPRLDETDYINAVLDCVDIETALMYIIKWLPLGTLTACMRGLASDYDLNDLCDFIALGRITEDE